jgi:hypothetical protein
VSLKSRAAAVVVTAGLALGGCVQTQPSYYPATALRGYDLRAPAYYYGAPPPQYYAPVAPLPVPQESAPAPPHSAPAIEAAAPDPAPKPAKPAAPSDPDCVGIWRICHFL